MDSCLLPFCSNQSMKVLLICPNSRLPHAYSRALASNQLSSILLSQRAQKLQFLLLEGTNAEAAIWKKIYFPWWTKSNSRCIDTFRTALCTSSSRTHSIPFPPKQFTRLYPPSTFPQTMETQPTVCPKINPFDYTGWLRMSQLLFVRSHYIWRNSSNFSQQHGWGYRWMTEWSK